METYNNPAKFFHWVIGLVFLGLLAVGFYMSGLERSPFKFELYGIHKALGISILALAVLRVVWRFIRPAPGHIETHQPWERALSGLVHFLLYTAMAVMPLSGWVMSSAGGHPVSFFGLFEVPAIVGENKALGGLANQIHEYAAYAILLALGLHFAGAAKHHILDRDVTLTRMSFFQGWMLNIILLVILGIMLAASYVQFIL